MRTGPYFARPYFARLCLRYAQFSGRFGEHPGTVGSGLVRYPSKRSQLEVDVVVFAPEDPQNPKRVLSLGEVKWNETVGNRHLARLARVRDLLDNAGYDVRDCVLTCYSGAGFNAGCLAGLTSPRSQWMKYMRLTDREYLGRNSFTGEHTVGHISYGASKAALDRITLTAAHEFADLDIRANVINSGPVDTGWIDATAHLGSMQPTPAKRIGTAQDAAHLMEFLYSPEGEWINGQLLYGECRIRSPTPDMKRSEKGGGGS